MTKLNWAVVASLLVDVACVWLNRYFQHPSALLLLPIAGILVSLLILVTRWRQIRQERNRYLEPWRRGSIKASIPERLWMFALTMWVTPRVCWKITTDRSWRGAVSRVKTRKDVETLVETLVRTAEISPHDPSHIPIEFVAGTIPLQSRLVSRGRQQLPLHRTAPTSTMVMLRREPEHGNPLVRTHFPEKRLRRLVPRLEEPQHANLPQLLAPPPKVHQVLRQRLLGVFDRQRLLSNPERGFVPGQAALAVDAPAPVAGIAAAIQRTDQPHGTEDAVQRRRVRAWCPSPSPGLRADCAAHPCVRDGPSAPAGCSPPASGHAPRPARPRFAPGRSASPPSAAGC